MILLRKTVPPWQEAFMKDKLLSKEGFRFSSEFVKTFQRKSEEYYSYIGDTWHGRSITFREIEQINTHIEDNGNQVSHCWRRGLQVWKEGGWREHWVARWELKVLVCKLMSLKYICSGRYRWRYMYRYVCTSMCKHAYIS